MIETEVDPWRTFHRTVSALLRSRAATRLPNTSASGSSSCHVIIMNWSAGTSLDATTFRFAPIDAIDYFNRAELRPVG
ncbi:hypothetical protein HMPREF0185_00317 [Brevundimonas diminuta 470-4]|nr:hypothetical protein HMPREF0185_00317 [Brevundimonas diminuta 470-4]